MEVRTPRNSSVVTVRRPCNKSSMFVTGFVLLYCVMALMLEFSRGNQGICFSRQHKKLDFLSVIDNNRNPLVYLKT